MNFKDITKIMDERSKHKVYCKCGHSIVLPPKLDFKICSWCGCRVVNQRKMFKEKLLDKLKEKK